MNCFRRNLPVILGSMFFSLWIIGCVDLPTDLKVPQWDVDLNVPLVNRSYTLNDIIKKQNYISVQGTSPTDSIYVLQSDIYSQRTEVAPFMQLTSQTSLTNQIVPLGNLGATFYLPIPNGATPVSAVFKTGLLSIHIANTNAADVTALITYPGIQKSDGSVLSLSIPVPANHEVTNQTVLDGYIYNLPDNQKTNNSNSLQLAVSTISSLSVLSSITLDINCSNFSFSSLTGYLPSKSLGTQFQSFPLNLGNAKDYRDKASLKYGKLDMDIIYYSPISNPFGIQVKNLNIIGIRDDGSQIMLKDSAGNSNITFTIGNGATHISFTEANSNINSFITFLPGKISLNAEYIMNPDNKIGTVTDQDSVVFSTNFSTKSIMYLQKSLITDTASVDISDQDTLKIKDAKSAYINVNVQNGIPLDSWLTINFVDKQYKPLFTITNSTNSDSIYFAAASVNADGEVANTVTTNNLIQLDSTQTAKLSRARHVIYTVAVQTSGAANSSRQYVAIRPNDLIKINVYGGVKYHINTDDLK